MTALHDTIGHDVLEQPAEQLHAVEVGGAGACTAPLTGGDRDRAVLEADEAWVGDGDPDDRGGTGGEGGVSVGLRLTLDVPGAGPDLRGEVRQQAGVAPVVFAERTVNGGEGLHRDTAVRASGSPGRAVL